MADSGVIKKGRGFETSAAGPKKNYAAQASHGHVGRGGVEVVDGRLAPPTFFDEEPDREEIVLAAKPNRGASHTNAYNRTGTITSSQESSGGVKLGSSPATSTTPASSASASTTPSSSASASQGKESEKPRPIRIRPGQEVYMPRFRREPAEPQNPTTVGREPPTGSAGLSSTGMDFSRMTRRSTNVQTLHQALRSQSIGDAVPPHVQKLHQALRSQSIGSDDKSNQQTAPAAPSASHPNTAPHNPAQSKQTPVPEEVLTRALKSLPPRAPQPTTPTNTAKATPEVVSSPPELVSSPPEEHSQLDQLPVETSSSDISTVIGSVASLKIEETSTTTIEFTTDLDSEAIVADNYDDISVEDSETYQLGSDEKFASESSDESESVTSTIRDYDEVSDQEAASEKAASEEDGEEDEIPKPKKTRAKRKPIETSDGKIYYPIAEGEEPYVPLSYNISTTELTRLLTLNEGSKLRVWSHNLYNHEKEITVECCSTLEEIETAAQRFLNEKAIGFDMEWLPRPSKHVWDNVSLIQVAKEDHIALFHLARIKKKNVEELIPPSLKQIIESKDILKLGVHIGGDGSRIRKWLGIEPQGLMELSSIHHVLEFARERRRGQIPRVLIALSKLCEQYLQLPISKGQVRISDWTKPLSPMQISYAATDAYAGLRIYDELQKARMLIDPIPMLPACVKCSEESKKRRVVTPKIYVDGVEQGTSGISTWDTQITVETTPEKPLEELDWADEVEQSRAAETAPTPAPRRRRGPAAKKPNANEVVNEETLQKGTGGRRRRQIDENEAGNDAAPIKKSGGRKRKSVRAIEAGNVERNEETPQKGSGARGRKAADNANEVTPAKARTADLPPPSPEYQSAVTWAQSHIEHRTVGISKPYQLKAYALWHRHALSVEDTARHMGVIPASAAQYISQAVFNDKLEHDAQRLYSLKNQYAFAYRRSN